MPEKDTQHDIRERTFQFSLRAVKLCQHLDGQSGVARILAKQLLRWATSVGANVEEAQAAQSRADFVNKYAVALKEAREAHYWLRLLGASSIVAENQVAGLREEANELMHILGAIVVSARKSKG